MVSMLQRALRYVLPHLVAVPFGIAFFFGVRALSSLGGACRFFCNPPVTLSMGVLAGLLGAQLYRSEHPVRGA